MYNATKQHLYNTTMYNKLKKDTQGSKRASCSCERLNGNNKLINQLA
jgi:hypothetical protein